MKKFFKALALLLALVLVIGTIPVSAADQSDFALKGKVNKKYNLHQKIIYLGHAQGVKDDEAGTVCKTGAWANVAKLVTGFDADTMYIELASSDKSIVRTESGKKMIDEGKYWIKSESVGSAPVSVTVKRISDDFVLFSDDLLVSVKKNAEAVDYKILDADGNDVTGKKLGANTDYTVVLTRLNEEGVQIDTDLRSLEGEKDVVEITPANDYTTLYTVKFLKSGNFTLKGNAYQSKTYNKVLKTVDIPVVVGYDVKDVTQSSIKSVKVTFDQKVAGLAASDFKAFYELTNGTPYYASSVEKVDMSENTATITFFSAFKQDTEYFLEYNGDKFAFHTAKIDANSVTDVVVDVIKVKAGSEQKIVYHLMNANGVDITGDASLSAGWATFEKVGLPETSYINTATESVYIQDAGVTGKVKVTWNWSDNGELKSKSGEGQVYSVAADKWVFSGEATGAATKNNADNYVKDNKINNDVVLKHVTLDYSTTGAAIQIAVKFDKVEADGNVLESKYETLDSASLVYTGYELQSNDEKVVMLKGKSGKYQYFITNGKGNANVLIKGIKADGSRDILGVVSITVEDARKATTFTASLKDGKVLLNKGKADDKVEIKAVLLDQYEEEFASQDVYVYRLDKGQKQELLATGKTGSKDVAFATLTGALIKSYDFAKGNLSIRVECGNMKPVDLAVSIGDEALANNYILNLSGDKLDTNVKLDNEKTSIQISLAGTANGYSANLASGAALKFASATPVFGADFSTVSYTEGDFVYTVDKDGKLITASSNNFDSDADVFTSVVAVSGSAIKLEKGTYNVKAYLIKKVNNKVGYTVIGTKSFTVTDNQTAITFEKNTATFENLTAPIAEAPADNAKIQTAFKNVKFGDKDITNDVTYEYTTDGSTAYVKKVSYKVVNEKGLGSFVVTVDVDVLVRAK